MFDDFFMKSFYNLNLIITNGEGKGIKKMCVQETGIEQNKKKNQRIKKH